MADENHGDATKPTAERDADRPSQTDIGSDVYGEVQDLLNDTEMPIDERQARLSELARRLGARSDETADEEFDPMQVQISEALQLLAGGGHIYSHQSPLPVHSETEDDAAETAAAESDGETIGQDVLGDETRR